MAKNMEPIVKRCRALGISPAVMGYSANSSKGNSTKRNPSAQKRVKKTEYALQLNEKQKNQVHLRPDGKTAPDVLREGVCVERHHR